MSSIERAVVTRNDAFGLFVRLSGRGRADRETGPCSKLTSAPALVAGDRVLIALHGDRTATIIGKMA